MKLQNYRKLFPQKHLRFDVHIVDHCNLKCKGCEHFSSIAKAKYLDIVGFDNDLARLSMLTEGEMRDISILGGEPLLHPQVTDFFDIARKHFPHGLIRVVTNGILLLDQPEAFWQKVKENNIKIPGYLLHSG